MFAKFLAGLSGAKPAQGTVLLNFTIQIEMVISF